MKRPGAFILPGLLGFLALGLAGCGDSTGPETSGPESGGLEVPEVAFQQNDLILGGFVFTFCKGWIWESLPQGDPVLVDLYFPHQGPGVRMGRITTEDINAVSQAGGEFVHMFNLPVIRARLPRTTLNQLWMYSPLSFARSVPNPGRFDVKVSVGYAGGEGTSVKGRFQELGGIITRDFEYLNAFYGVISDAAIPSFDELGEAIVWLALRGVGCFW